MPFELQPTLEGPLLMLRPLRPDDILVGPDSKPGVRILRGYLRYAATGQLYAAASDPLIWEQHPESDRYKPDVFRRYFDSGLASGGAFVVVDRRTGRIIGSTRYHGYDEATSQVEIGWTFLEREFWGGSYNREMKQLLLAHAFRHVVRVVFNVGRTNYRSQRAMEKIGGVRAGTCVNSLGQESVVFVIEAPPATP